LRIQQREGAHCRLAVLQTFEQGVCLIRSSLDHRDHAQIGQRAHSVVDQLQGLRDLILKHQRIALCPLQRLIEQALAILVGGIARRTHDR